MSSSIKVCARVRPLLAHEQGKSPALDAQTGSESSIRITRDGETKYYFSRVWNADSTQEEVFQAVGKPSVDDVLEGFHATIFVYGQTGTGKTHTLGCTVPGQEGIQPRAINYLFERAQGQRDRDLAVTAEYVQLYRDSMIDLLDPSKDRLDLRSDEVHGATVEGNTRVVVRSTEQFHALVQLGDRNRNTANTRLNSSSSRSHACLIITVRLTPKDTPSLDATTTGRPSQPRAIEGKLYLIDLAGSERIAKSGATGDSYKEAVAINKSLTVLGTCVHGIANGFKHIPFRDSKLTRLLQHCLTGNGKTSVIVTVHPSWDHVSETSSTLKFGERAMKVQAQMTIGDYREQVAAQMLRCSQLQEGYASSSAQYTADEDLLVEAQAACEEKVSAIRTAEDNIFQEVVKLRQEMDEGLAGKLRHYQAQVDAQKAKIHRDMEKLRASNKERVDAAVKHRQDKNEAMQAETDAFRARYEEALAAVVKRGEDIRAEAKPTIPDEEAIKKRLETARQELAAMKHDIRDKTPSPHEGKSLRELKQIVAHLRHHNASLASKARDMKHLIEDNERTQAYINSTPAAQDEESNLSLTASFGIGTAVTDFTPTPPSSPSSGGNEMERERKTYLSNDEVQFSRKKDNIQISREEEDDLFKHVETRQMKDALRKEQHFRELLERILQYLEAGTPVWRVTNDHDIVRQFMYTERAHGQLYIVRNSADGEPNRQDYADIVELRKIEKVSLGQMSENFRHFHPPDFKPDHDKRDDRVDTEVVVTESSVPDHFYKSFSLVDVNGVTFDIIASVHNDFEAWVTGLNRLGHKPGFYETFRPGPQRGDGSPLAIADLPMYDELDEDERACCSELHLPPALYLSAREHVVSDSRIFITLYDVRTLTGLDLWTSQQLVMFFTQEQYIERHTLWLVASKKSGMQGPGRRHLD